MFGATCLPAFANPDVVSQSLAKRAVPQMIKGVSIVVPVCAVVRAQIGRERGEVVDVSEGVELGELRRRDRPLA